jgi:hypothetical protein
MDVAFFIVIVIVPGGRIGTVAAILNVWFAFWAIRWRGDLDIPLDATAKAVRWILAISFLSFPIAFPHLIDSSAFRLSVGLTGWAFLCWPNLAFHFTKLLRAMRILPPTAQVPD